MKLRNIQLPFLLMLVICFEANAQKTKGRNDPIQKSVTCIHGAVVSAHPLASKVGLDILKQGGNAIDAAIATQLALAVVYPIAGNIGGGGFLVAHLKNGKNISIDFREKAPAQASRDMYLDAQGNPVMNLSQDGHRAVGVPGTVAGIFASIKYAKLPFKLLIQPAIELAEKGFKITKTQAQGLNEVRTDFLIFSQHQTPFTKYTPWKEGELLVQPELANTLKRIRDHGQKGFYEGETARLLIEEMKRGKGKKQQEDIYG